MTREKFSDIVKESLLLTNSELFTDQKALEVLKKEIDEEELLEKLRSIVNTFKSQRYNLIEFNLEESLALYQVCSEQRKELKNLETTLLNDAVNKIIVKKKRVFRKDANALKKELFANAPAQLLKQTKILLNQEQITGEPGSVKEVQAYESKAEEILALHETEVDGVQDIYFEFGNDESCGNNYLKRYMLLREIYEKNVTDFYKCLIDLRNGFHYVFGFEVIVPDPVKNRYLNDCFFVLQRISNDLKVLHAKERSGYVSIPLKGNYSYVARPDVVAVANPAVFRTKIVIADDKFAQGIASGIFEFNLLTLFETHGDILAIQSIGIAVRDSTSAAENPASPDPDCWNARLDIDKTFQNQFPTFFEKISVPAIAPNNMADIQNYMTDSLELLNHDPLKYKFRLFIADESMNRKKRATIKGITLVVNMRYYEKF